jgi:hypothetical protein
LPRLALESRQPSPGRRKGKKKTTLCLDGQTIEAAEGKKKKLLKRGATQGGGIAHTSAATGPLELTNRRITGNTALVGSGAGLILENSTQPVTITGCTISGNTSSLAGGGI